MNTKVSAAPSDGGKCRTLTDEEEQQVSEVEQATDAFSRLLKSLPPSRERSIAITKLEESSMWAIRGLTA